MIFERYLHGTRVRVECDATLASAAQEVLSTVERLAGDRPPKAGLRVHFGWSVLTLKNDPDGGLRAHEPDFAGDAMGATRPTLDTTLSVLARQVTLLRQLSVCSQEVSFDQSVVVARRAHAASAVMLTRWVPLDADDSGWMVDDALADTDADDEQLAVVPVYELLVHWPAALAAVALPSGFRVMLEGGRITRVWEESGHRRSIRSEQ